MKPIFTKTLLLASALCMSAAQSSAIIYTVAQSGNFSANSTWVGGTKPPTQLGANDIVVPAGMTLTMDVNLDLSNSNSVLQFQGTGKMVGTTTNYLLCRNGFMTGTGTNPITVDSVYIGSTSFLNYSGGITAKKVTLSSANIGANMAVTAEEKLYLAGAVTNLDMGSSISLGTGTPRPVIVLQGGNVSAVMGIFNLSTPYDVRYASNAANIGPGVELTGTGLRKIEVAIPSNQSINLASPLTVKTGLILTSGNLGVANGNHLTISDSATITGSGKIFSDANTDIIITSNAADLGTITFGTTAGANVVRAFTMNAVSPSASLKLGSNMMVDQELTLQSGILNVQGNTVSINQPNGMIIGGSANSYILTEANGKLQQPVEADSMVTYHVGNVNGYAPVTIKSNNSSFMPELAVNVVAGVKQAGTVGPDLATLEPLVNATWTLSHAGTPASVDYDIEAMWSAAAEVNSFDRTVSFVTKFQSSNGKWEKNTPSAATTSGSMYANKKTGNTTFGMYTVFDLFTLDITDVETGAVIAAYPNPATNTISFSLNSLENITATVYSTNGSAVATATVNKNNNSINISHLAAGVYYIQLSGNDFNGTTKFVKQ